jgi:hypothetical protein
LSFVYNSIKQDKLIAFSKPSELPNSAKHDRKTIEKMGIKSALIVPLKTNDIVHFGLSLSNIGKHRQWEKMPLIKLRLWQISWLM